MGTSQHLVIESQNDVSYHFGQSGDFVSNGIGHVYIINNAPQTPFKGKVIKNVPNNGLYGAGRLLVQNKGLMLWACDNPLPATIDKANATEKAVILAIAMQASILAIPLLMLVLQGAVTVSVVFLGTIA